MFWKMRLVLHLLRLVIFDDVSDILYNVTDTNSYVQVPRALLSEHVPPLLLFVTLLPDSASFCIILLRIVLVLFNSNF